MQSEPSSQDEPKGLCQCGHAGHLPRGRGYSCTTQGCDCKWYTLVAPEPTIINDRCKCSHDRFRHNWGSESDGACSKPDCDCKAYAPVTVETVELPEPDDSACTEDFRRAQCYSRHTEDCPYVDPGEIPVEAYAEAVSAAVTRMRAENGPLPLPEGPEYTPCVSCGHIEPEHDLPAKRCLGEGCPCQRYRPDRPEPGACAACGSPDSWVDRSICAEPCGGMHDRCSNCGEVLGFCALEHPPQPERRPPLSVAYSVAGGHAYEVSVPGDASVTALDGALIITHPDAQVLAITRVAPIEESP